MIEKKDKENTFLYREYVFDTLNKKKVEGDSTYLIFPNYFEEKIYLDDKGISEKNSNETLMNFLNKLKEGFGKYVNNRGYNFNPYGWRGKDDDSLITFIVEWFAVYKEKTS